MPRAEDYWPDFPVILGQGSCHDLRDADETKRSRLWDLRSTSKAACQAYDASSKQSPRRRVGFIHRKPK